MSDSLQRTPLFEQHRQLGARMVPFAGYEMPVQYSSVVEEHRAVRSRAGLFDVSHMGELRVTGPQAVEFAQRVFSNHIASAELGRVRYGMFCNEAGGVIDDVTAYRSGASEVLFCVNAANRALDLDWLQKQLATGDFDCQLRDESAETALLAIQGPAALEIAGTLLDSTSDRPGRWRFSTTRLAGCDVVLSRTGYSGEDGYEIYLSADDAPDVWQALLDAGARPAGLGARDTLRTEMGYPLHGHELDADHTPLEAGLERFLAFGTGFRGEAALARQRVQGVRRRLVGIVLEGRRVARTGFAIRTEHGPGIVTSGTFGPSVEQSIAIGYVPVEASADGTQLQVEIRGKPAEGRVTGLPFFRREKGI